MRKNKASNKEYIITWRWIDEEEEQKEYGNSAGLASLLADWCVEVLKVEVV